MSRPHLPPPLLVSPLLLLSAAAGGGSAGGIHMDDIEIPTGYTLKRAQQQPNHHDQRKGSADTADAAGGVGLGVGLGGFLLLTPRAHRSSSSGSGGSSSRADSFRYPSFRQQKRFATNSSYAGSQPSTAGGGHNQHQQNQHQRLSPGGWRETLSMLVGNATSTTTSTTPTTGRHPNQSNQNRRRGPSDTSVRDKDSWLEHWSKLTRRRGTSDPQRQRSAVTVVAVNAANAANARLPTSLAAVNEKLPHDAPAVNANAADHGMHMALPPGSRAVGAATATNTAAVIVNHLVHVPNDYPFPILLRGGGGGGGGGGGESGVAEKIRKPLQEAGQADRPRKKLAEALLARTERAAVDSHALQPIVEVCQWRLGGAGVICLSTLFA